MSAPERYELIEELGSGAMAVVYRARDLALGRDVAVKILRHEYACDPQFLARMQREAQVVAKLDHPNIVRLYDVREDALVMELVQGQRLQLDRLALPERLRVIEDVARAVHAAHEHGVVHRDLKPDNILMEPSGRVVLTDFGLAHLADARSRLTRSGAAVGTPLYMAPEQIRGEPADGRADVYSLGVMLYEAFAGRPPFMAHTIIELYKRVLHEEPPRLPGAAPDFVTVCLRALAKDPRDRYTTAAAFADDLSRLRKGEAVSSRHISSWSRIARRIVRRKVAGLIGIVVITLAFTAGIATLRLRHTQGKLSEAQHVLLEQMRATSVTCLEATLDLRRIGKLDRMPENAAKLEEICQGVIHEMPYLAEPHYLRGRMLRVQMRYKEALNEQNQALAKDPFYGPALYERIVLTAREQWCRGIKVRDPHRDVYWPAQKQGEEIMDPPAELDQARSSAEVFAGQIKKDLDALAKCTQQLREGQLLCVRGWHARVSLDLEKARQYFAQAVSQDPSLEEGYEGLVEMEYTLSPPEQAFQRTIACLDEAIRTDRGYVPYYKARAIYLLSWATAKSAGVENRNALLEAAVRDYDEVLRLDAMDPTAWCGRGTVREVWAWYRCEEDPLPLMQASADDYAEALRLDPSSQDARYRRAELTLNRARYEQGRGKDPTDLFRAALDDLDELLKLNPELSEAWTERGLIRANWATYKVGQHEDPGSLFQSAVDDLGEAIRLKPENDAAWWWRGGTRGHWAFYKATQGELLDPLFQSAVEDFDESLKLRPAHSGIWVERGVVHANWAVCKHGHGEDPSPLYQTAIENCGKAMELNPGNYEAWMRRGMARLNWSLYIDGAGMNPSELLDAAVDDLHHCISINRSVAATWHLMGNAHYARAERRRSERMDGREDYRTAVESYEEAVRLNPTLAAPLQQRIDSCRRLVELSGDR
ncbi:MAG: protein kinase [Planctomycetes bacterium]|nr:protein kinase [Planctomycetota bacterium]